MTNPSDSNAIITHRTPEKFSDYVAFYIVKFLRFFADLIFKKRYGHRAVILETVAGVPGMVGGMIRHLRSLRLCKDDGGWIKQLLEEAENERMHLMTFIKIAPPNWFERLLIILTQGCFFTIYLVLYILSPRIAHRIVGYLEEEAVISYTEYLYEVDNGSIQNIPAPQIAIDYWNLPSDARLKDLIIVVRNDEAGHREKNHQLANLIEEGSI